jgi:hypothetical protein
MMVRGGLSSKGFEEVTGENDNSRRKMKGGLALLCPRE